MNKYITFDELITITDYLRQYNINYILDMEDMSFEFNSSLTEEEKEIIFKLKYFDKLRDKFVIFFTYNNTFEDNCKSLSMKLTRV